MLTRQSLDPSGVGSRAPFGFKRRNLGFGLSDLLRQLPNPRLDDACFVFHGVQLEEQGNGEKSRKGHDPALQRGLPEVSYPDGGLLNFPLGLVCRAASEVR